MSAEGVKLIDLCKSIKKNVKPNSTDWEGGEREKNTAAILQFLAAAHQDDLFERDEKMCWFMQHISLHY